MKLANLPTRYRRQALAQLSRPKRDIFAAQKPKSRQTRQDAPSCASLPSDGSSPVPTPKTRSCEARAAESTRSRLSPFPSVSVLIVSSTPDSVVFRLPLDPSRLPTAQQKGASAYIGRDGRAHAHFYTKAHIAAAYGSLRDAFASLGFPSARFADVPLEVSALFRYPFPVSTPKRDRLENAPMTVRPDVENVWKAVGDSLTRAGIWGDDSQIARLRLDKVRTNGSGDIEISVRALPPGQPLSNETTNPSTTPQD